jgi:hypothetical protein
MEIKGMIFSPDAMLGIAIVILLFSAATLTTWTEPKNYSQKNITYHQATDEAIWRFYINNNENNNTPIKEDLICATVIKYTITSGTIENGMKVCK